MNLLRIISGLLHFDRTNWKAVSLCVLTATVFWIFNAFNKIHSTSLEFPLTFEFNSVRFAPAHSLPPKIKINVSGNGWELFTKYVGFKMPHLLVPLARPVDTKKIVGASLVPTFASQIGGLHINYVVTDTLKIQLDARDKHSFKLEADLSKITFENGYGRISPVVILPDSVSIDGPQSILHQLPSTIPVAVQEDRISSNYKSELEIEIAGKDFVTRSPSTARIIFEVGRVQEVLKKIRVDKKIKLVSDSVSILFQVPVDKVSDFNMIANEMVASIQKSSVHLSHLPPYALFIKMDSIPTIK